MAVKKNSLYTVLSVSFPENSKSEMLLLNLDIAGISCSGGSACTSGMRKRVTCDRSIASARKNENHQIFIFTFKY